MKPTRKSSTFWTYKMSRPCKAVSSSLSLMNRSIFTSAKHWNHKPPNSNLTASAFQDLRPRMPGKSMRSTRRSSWISSQLSPRTLVSSSETRDNKMRSQEKKVDGHRTCLKACRSASKLLCTSDLKSLRSLLMRTFSPRETLLTPAGHKRCSQIRYKAYLWATIRN